MKKSILLASILLISICSFAQERNLLVNGSPINKGKITFGDGTSVKFRNLIFSNERLRYTNIHGEVMEKSSSEVFKVTKTSSYAGYGALSGGLSGLMACLQYSVDENNYGYYGYKKEPLTTSQYVMVTAIGAGIGGVIGMLFSKDKTVFQNSSAISFSPYFYPNSNKAISPILTLSLTFKT